MTDYVSVAKAYAQEAIKDKKRSKFCRLMRQAAKRFMADLKRAKKKDSPFYFDEDAANEVCWFIEQMPHVEGEWDNPNIRLHPSHTFFLVQLFGFKKQDGTRRFSTALFAVARKNAKSTVAAPVGLYLLTQDGQVGPQIISGATTGDQARIIWGIAKRMAEKEHEFREAYGVECLANAIFCHDNGGTFKPVNAKASTQDGLNPSAVLLDEVHAHKTPDLINVLDSAAGARKSRLFLYTTTEGYVSAGPWPELRAFAKNMLEGTVEADHFLVSFYQLDDDDDIHDESKWHKANPLLEVNPTLLEAIRKDSIEARAMPSKLAEFKIKRCNREAVSSDSWVDLVAWEKCGGEVDLEWLKDYPCYAGLDLAATSDLNSIRLYWVIDGKAYTWGRNWCPRDAAQMVTLTGVPRYAGWVEQGYIDQTPGNVADYSIIERDLIKLYGQFRIEKIAYDPWNASDLVNRLVDEGLPMVQFIQGPKSYHPAMQHLERMYKQGALSHGGDPVLKWAMANVIPRYDANMNQAPDKKNAPDKIDPACALFMACGAYVSENDMTLDDGYEIVAV